jgi:hypothetical protein
MPLSLRPEEVRTLTKDPSSPSAARHGRAIDKLGMWEVPVRASTLLLSISIHGASYMDDVRALKVLFPRRDGHRRAPDGCMEN